MHAPSSWLQDIQHLANISILASRRLDSHPPSLVNPMFIISCTATCILESGWLTAAGVEVASTIGADGVGPVAVDAVLVGGGDSGATEGTAVVAASTKFKSFSSPM